MRHLRPGADVYRAYLTGAGRLGPRELLLEQPPAADRASSPTAEARVLKTLQYGFESRLAHFCSFDAFARGALSCIFIRILYFVAFSARRASGPDGIRIASGGRLECPSTGGRIHAISGQCDRSRLFHSFRRRR